jgi:hypothetical protein
MAQGNPLPAPSPAAGGIKSTGKIDRHHSANTCQKIVSAGIRGIFGAGGFGRLSEESMDQF